jgi:hypothetical protein
MRPRRLPPLSGPVPQLHVRPPVSVALIVAVAAVAAVVFIGRSNRRRPLVIRAPRFGILNLKGEGAEQLIAADAAALRPVFGNAVRGTTSSPFCDVLFIYCDIGSDGRVGNFAGTLRDLIQTLRAPLVVVASENSGDAYIATTKGHKHGRANLVMTLSRKGAAFPSFFVHLFTEMKRGVSMPVAWVKLAPQGPVKEHDNLPSTIFACEAGQMVFG